jgi:hypothetical protein
VLQVKALLSVSEEKGFHTGNGLFLFQRRNSDMWQTMGKRWWSVLCVWALMGVMGLAVQAVEVKNLRCEYLTDPLGIDVVKPRLSWTLESSERGECQKAYQVLVAASQKDLDAEQGGLWDSGKIESDQSIQVEYAASRGRRVRRASGRCACGEWMENPPPGVNRRTGRWVCSIRLTGRRSGSAGTMPNRRG